MKAKEIAKWLATRRSSPFCFRQQICVVPNVSYGLLDYEADLIACSKAGYLSEIEIKVSYADWKADAFKSKWLGDRELIKNFYYACPMELAQRWPELIDGKNIDALGFNDLRDRRCYEEWLKFIIAHAGIIGVTESGKVRVLREAKPNNKAKKLSVEQQLKLARLGSMRIWTQDFRLLPEACGDSEGIAEEIPIVADEEKI